MTVSNYRIRESKRIYAEQEKAALDRKIGPLIAEQEKTLRQIHATIDRKVTQYYGVPIAELLSTDPRDEGGLDNDFTAPMRQGERNISEEKKGFTEFTKSLKSKRGLTLHLETNAQVLICYAITHSIRGFDFSL